jgi:hypothetical protein
MKTEKVHQYGDSEDESDADIMGFMACVRQGKQIFVVYHGPGPLAPRKAAYWSAAYTQCDEFFLIADARYKTIPPEEEADYEPGTLGEMWERGEREHIQETIVITRFPLLGPPKSAHYNYERQGRQITWTHVSDIPYDITGGAIDDFVKAGFKQRVEISTKIAHHLEQMAAEAGLTRDEERYHTDRGLASWLSKCDGVFIVQVLQDESTFMNGEEVNIEPGSNFREQFGA